MARLLYRILRATLALCTLLIAPFIYANRLLLRLMPPYSK